MHVHLAIVAEVSSADVQKEVDQVPTLRTAFHTFGAKAFVFTELHVVEIPPKPAQQSETVNKAEIAQSDQTAQQIAQLD
jgi:hypothetical protein